MKFLLLLLCLLAPSSAEDGGEEDGGLVYANIWAVELRPGADPDAAAAGAGGFVNEGPVLPDEAVFEFWHPGVAERSRAPHHVS